MPSRITLKRPVNVLLSYHSNRRANLSGLTDNGLRCIGDSGAFSAFTQGAVIDIAAYADWVKTNRAHLLWAASLDVIGDADASYRNFKTLRETYGLDVVPTIHYGTDPKVLRAYIDDGVDFIGLGGMVKMKNEPMPLLRWSAHVMKWAQDNAPQVRFHGWGVTHQLLTWNLPWYSNDSAGWANPWMMGTWRMWDPVRNKIFYVKADGKSMLKHERLVRDYYGIEAKDIADYTKDIDVLAAHVSAKTYEYVQDYLRSRFNVSAPTYGLNDALTGPHHHFVGTNVSGLIKQLGIQGESNE